MCWVALRAGLGTRPFFGRRENGDDEFLNRLFSRLPLEADFLLNQGHTVDFVALHISG